MIIVNKLATVIVGGGIAGAATAYFLTQQGLRDVIILEREQTAGAHSTGRNAAILRTLIPENLLRRLAREAAEFYRHTPAGFSENPLLDPVGICLAAREGHSPGLLACLGDGNEKGAPRQVAPETVYKRIPQLAPGLATVLEQSDEGVLDVDAILQAFLRAACRNGAELRTSCEAVKLRVGSKSVLGVETPAGFLPAERVIIATGGWAASLAANAGYPIPLVPHRRHLLVTEPLPQIDRHWPVIWIFGDEFYFRPESGGLLMCGCDAVPVPPDQGEVVDPSQIEGIATKAARWLPSLSDARVARSWAGMRTFAPDQQFVVGADPRLRGLFWVAGLGGHGITCAPMFGKIAAELIVSGGCSHPAAAAFAPSRLFKQK
ncbi:MAG: dependent oxidoreductase [Acidobacteria bacterium]|nr:dependent oxidoreductase [Acidobacteriota bacterium]